MKTTCVVRRTCHGRSQSSGIGNAPRYAPSDAPIAALATQSSSSLRTLVIVKRATLVSQDAWMDKTTKRVDDRHRRTEGSRRLRATLARSGRGRRPQERTRDSRAARPRGTSAARVYEASKRQSVSHRFIHKGAHELYVHVERRAKEADDDVPERCADRECDCAVYASKRLSVQRVSDHPHTCKLAHNTSTNAPESCSCRCCTAARWKRA